MAIDGETRCGDRPTGTAPSAAGRAFTRGILDRENVGLLIHQADFLSFGLLLPFRRAFDGIVTPCVALRCRAIGSG
jgi:hypothetical protein